MIKAREAALLTLYDIIYNGAYSNLALKERLAVNRGMEPREKALLTNLVYGVVSRHFTLIYIIKKYSSIRLNKIDKNIMLILELGLYQLLYTDKIPDRAAVDESVKLARKKNKHASGFVNAVLRSFIRDGKVIEYPAQGTPEFLAVKYSYTSEMARLFMDNFHERTESVMQALNEPPRLIIRANILKNNAGELKDRLKRDGIDSSQIPGTELLVCDGFDIADSILYSRGYFSVQDAAAYNTAIVLDPQPGETVIDMCAAPGGKSTHIAELMGDDGKVIACDIHENKLRLIESSAIRLGLKSVSAELSDGTICKDDYIGIADRVLCDVPCSGLGIIRRKPDIKLGKNDISALPDIQLSILENGSKFVKSGGMLVYSTCTINKYENEEVTGRFLNNSEDFIKTYEKLYLPDEDGTDGFYICKMERK